MPRSDDSVTAVELVDPLVGTIFDKRFRVDERLAAGGFGAIYRATHVKSGHQIALKVLHPTLASDLGVLARFRREGTTLTSLRNKHTITAYEFGQADKTLFIVMELLKGETLFDRYSNDGPMAWKRVIHIATQVCESLEEAHAQGIVHRDLKPTNIHLEDHDGDPDFVKVLDFGIAKILRGSEHDASDITNAGQMIGTLDYMSPEQMVGGQVTGQTDIYTLGIVMYEMIAGTRPFPESETAGAALAAMLKTTPEPLYLRAPIPRELDAIVMRCLERETQKRFRTVGELRAALLAAGGEDAPANTATVQMPKRAFDTDDDTTVTPPPDKILDALRAGKPLPLAVADTELAEQAETLKTPRRDIKPPPATPPGDARTPRFEKAPAADARTPRFEKTPSADLKTPRVERKPQMSAWDEDDERAPTTTRRPDGQEEDDDAAAVTTTPDDPSTPTAPMPQMPPKRPTPMPMTPLPSRPSPLPLPMSPPLRPLESKHIATPVPQIVVAPFSSSPRSPAPVGQGTPPPAGAPVPGPHLGYAPAPQLPPTPPPHMGVPTHVPHAASRPHTGGYDMARMAARDAAIRRLVWIVVLVIGAGAGFIVATQL